MVLGLWTKAPADEVECFKHRPEDFLKSVNLELIQQKYWKFYRDLELGAKVYVPLFDSEAEVADVIEEFVCVEGILPDSEWLELFPWEFEVL
jgi:hypothetical protein